MKTTIIVICLSLYCFEVQSQQNNIDSLKKILEISKTDTAKVKLMIKLSSNYFEINIDSAIYYAELSLQWAGLSKNKELEIESQLNFAYILGERDIPKSMSECFKALQIAEKIADKKNIAICYEYIGLLHLYLGNANLYIDYLQKAIAIYTKLNDLSGIIHCYCEIGGAHSNQDSARYYLNLAAKDSTNFNSAYYNYYWGINETDQVKARDFFLKSIDISEKEKNFRSLSLASRWLSILYQKNGDIDLGILAAKRGLEAAQQINLQRGIKNNSEQLTIIYKNLDQIDSAYKYQTIMLAAKDGLFSQDKINQIQNSIIEEQQRVQNLEAEKNTFKFRIKLYVALGIALVLLLLTLIIYRNHRKTQLSNFLLQSHQVEIAKKNFELQQSLDNLKSTQTQLIQSEKMASLGQLTAGIAHEIQNPLNFVNNFSEISNELVDEMKEELAEGCKQYAIGSRQSGEEKLKLAEEIANDIKQNLEKINHHGKRAESIVKGMLLHSRGSSGHKEPTDINALCDEYLRLSYHGFRAKDKSFNAKYKTEYDPNLPKINVVPQDIGRVLLNLINNAFYAVAPPPPKGGIKNSQTDYKPIVTVRTTFQNPPSGGRGAFISVIDNGPGIPDSIKDKIFQPFFTTKPTGQGTGLGLSLAYDIVKAHGGELKVESSEGAGSEFKIFIPVNNPE
jgi:signal transduction histidine kinase